jgi:hypothetical protein
MQTVSIPRALQTERRPKSRLETRLADRLRVEEARRFRETLNQANAAAELPQQDGYVKRLMQRINKGTLRIAEHLLVLVRSWFDRKTPRAIVEAPFRCALSIIASWYPAPSTDLRELSRAETIAQGPADVFQMDIEHLEGPALAAAERAIAKDVEAGQALLDAIRLKLYAAQLPPVA